MNSVSYSTVTVGMGTTKTIYQVAASQTCASASITDPPLPTAAQQPSANLSMDVFECCVIFMHCVCARQVWIAAAFKGLGFAAVYLTVYNYQKGILFSTAAVAAAEEVLSR